MRQWYINLAHEYRDKAKTIRSLCFARSTLLADMYDAKADEYLDLALDASDY